MTFEKHVSTHPSLHYNKTNESVFQSTRRIDLVLRNHHQGHAEIEDANNRLSLGLENVLAVDATRSASVARTFDEGSIEHCIIFMVVMVFITLSWFAHGVSRLSWCSKFAFAYLFTCSSFPIIISSMVPLTFLLDILQTHNELTIL